MSASAQLVASNASFSYGPRVVIRDASVTLAPGDRLGVVGPNGTGKTTFLRLLAGQLVPETGTIARQPATTTVGLVRQQLQDKSGDTVLSYATRTTGIGEIEAEFENAVGALAAATVGSDERYDRALQRYVDADVASFQDRLQRTLSYVGLNDMDLEAKTWSLSGGERTKLGLAALLLAQFDVLLLDEPTNDLDLRGLDLLEELIETDDRPMAIVSHDRVFLERVVTAVYAIDDHDHTGLRFNGGFAAWQEQRDITRRHHEEDYAAYVTKRADLTERARVQQQWSAQGVRKAKNDKSEADKFILAHRIATSEKVASKAKQTEKALERLERRGRVEAPWQPWELRLSFAAADRSGAEVASLFGAIVDRGSFRLGPIDASVAARDRIVITGDNGSGKTTLLNALLGEVPLSSGTHRLGPGVRVALMRQQRELLPAGVALSRAFADEAGLDDHEARSQLAKLGLGSEQIERSMVELSPGEQTRVALGLFAVKGSNLLVLDEPTNHLDLSAIEQLEAALAVFPHTVLLVTHDRRLLESVDVTRRWHMHAGRLDER